MSNGVGKLGSRKDKDIKQALDERDDGDHPGLWMDWIYTVTNVRADSKGAIRKGGFVPHALYKIIAPAPAPEGVSTINITGMGTIQDENGNKVDSTEIKSTEIKS